MVEWKNVGGGPIRTVKANLKTFDAAGRFIATAAPDYPIYSGSSEGPGVAPGETYQRHSGFIVPGTDVAKAEVEITSVSETGF